MNNISYRYLSEATGQAILPFVLETTYEIITPRAGLVLFGEFLYGLTAC